ncbi:Response regulator of citrate/malate metabolism [Pedococcus dokdonensis]|uniref:Transcriptional regulatory protein n=1 Tax=Pedococcus dokdonensis TaxID=443156 RepID=A0A1H0T911_9MICO|nr:response regulator [Pedococcus dokdonensis]SDP50553.1 Response regulator of citrate/malate metabolism [Pedococcus dokdonensis]
MISVLVVDDDFMVARLHSSVVAREEGFEVAGIASTGTDALRAVEATRPDLVLLDIYLPDMTGLEVLRGLREGGNEDLDVIVISAARDLDTLRTALRGGVFHYLVKPFEIESLQQRLREYAVHRAELDDLTEVGQDDVDRVFRAGAVSRSGGGLPKGISPETIELVLRALEAADEDGLSATECAESTGLSRSSTRRYLEHLVSVGRAEMRPRYGAAGRPERRYRMR